MEEGDLTAQQPVAEQPPTNDEGLPINPTAEPVEDSTIPEEILADMHNVWSVFALEKQESVPIKELRTIMRALDYDLNPQELEITRQKIDPTGSGIITFANLKLVMEDKLASVETPDDLKKVFKKLFNESMNEEDVVMAPLFKRYMANLGSKLPAEEIEAMLKEAGPTGQGEIDIMAFCERLCPVPAPEKKKS